MQAIASECFPDAANHRTAAEPGTDDGSGQPAPIPVVTGVKAPARTQSRPRRWAIAAACALTLLLLYGLFHSRPAPGPRVPGSADNLPGAKTSLPSAPAPLAHETAPPAADFESERKLAARSPVPFASTAVASAADPAASAGPMIARTVSLVIQVKDIAAARSALDAILARYQGYAAELNINTPENTARSFGASLRIPAPALPAALVDLRKLGRVQVESQSGEEVTRQHTDLAARLNNARQTELRLIAILQKRTGKVSEVLEVEEQISSTRGEIERMEAELKALQHRVDFATVQLQLAEQFMAQLNPPAATVGAQMHNAFIDGLGNAGHSILGLLLFFEEYGPVLLVWFTVLGTPLWLVWRRYRKAESRA